MKSIKPQSPLARLAANRGMTSAKPSALPMRPLPRPNLQPSQQRLKPKKTTRPEPTKEATPAKPAVAPSNAVFPTAVSSKYSSQSAGKARMHTCLDQYHANKANNANGGLRWIMKGGGYYSECNKRLKG